MNQRKHNSERSQRTQGPSLPATSGFLPVPQAPLYLPPPQTLSLPPGVPHPKFSLQFPPGHPPRAGYSVPCPAFPPAPANTKGVQTPHSNMVPTRQAPPLSREEFFRVQGLLKEESKYHYKGSSYLRSSHMYTKSRSGSTGSTSCSRSFRFSHSSSSSRSPQYPRRGIEERVNYCSPSRTHGYQRSRSRSPLYSPYHSESRSPQTFRGLSPTKSKLPQGEKGGDCFPRYRDVTSPFEWHQRVMWAECQFYRLIWERTLPGMGEDIPWVVWQVTNGMQWMCSLDPLQTENSFLWRDVYLPQYQKFTLHKKAQRRLCYCKKWRKETSRWQLSRQLSRRDNHNPKDNPKSRDKGCENVHGNSKGNNCMLIISGRRGSQAWECSIF